MILLVRPDHNEADEKALADVGLATLTRPVLQVIQPADPAPARTLATRMSNGGTLFLTSPRTWALWSALVPGIDGLLDRGLARGLEIWTVGARTAASVPARARTAVHTGSGVSAADLLVELESLPPGTALLPQSALARPTLAWGLGLRGWRVHTAEVYSVAPVPDPDLPATSVIDAVVLRSPSAVRALSDHLPPGSVPVFTVGPTTTATARELGWSPRVINSTSPSLVAEAVRAGL